MVKIIKSNKLVIENNAELHEFPNQGDIEFIFKDADFKRELTGFWKLFLSEESE